MSPQSVARRGLTSDLGLRILGFRQFLVLSVLLCLNAWWELKNDQIIWAILDLPVAAGAIGSAIWARWGRGSHLSPMPLYLSLWLVSYPFFYLQDTIHNPYFSAYMMTLFIGGTFIQSLQNTVPVFIFTLANYVGWVALAFWKSKSMMETREVITIAQTSGLFLFGTYILVNQFVKRELSLVENADRHSERLREVESNLTQSEKMAEVGKLLAGTAHELAQPVQVICNSSSLLNLIIREQKLNPELLKQLSDRISDSSTRIIRLLSQIRDFARKDPFELKVIDLREAANAVSLLAQHDLIAQGISFDLCLSEEPVWVSGDSLRLQQVILNLLNNAKDAALGSIHPRIQLRVLSVNQWVRIEVENTGPAIPLKVQAKLFEPYFTTKPKGKGTGLGLSICSQLVNQHGGRILFSSQEDETLFVIDLPALNNQVCMETTANHMRTVAQARTSMMRNCSTSTSP